MKGRGSGSEGEVGREEAVGEGRGREYCGGE